MLERRLPGAHAHSRFGKVERVRFLLDHKKLEVDASEQSTRWTALHYACRHGQVYVVQLLVGRGADPDAVDESGNTPLHLAAGWGNLRCCVLMLEAGARVTAKNLAQQTPLSVAQALSRKDIAALLGRWQPLLQTPEELRAQGLQRTLSESGFSSAFLTALNEAAKDEPDPRVRSELHALHSKVHSYGAEHPGLLMTFDKLVSLYRESNRAEKALEMADRGLSLSEALHGENHFETAAWLNNVGELLLLLGRHQDQKGENSLEALVALENAAIAHHSSGDLVVAIDYLQQLLARLDAHYSGGWNEKLLQLSLKLAATLFAQSEAVVRCIEGVGTCCFVLGDFSSAESHFSRALRDTLADARPTASDPEREADRQRAHRNLASVALAKKSAAVVRDKLKRERWDRSGEQAEKATSVPKI
ncbi:hypothetical protein PybrP1_000509 [[Pythium] brassicae (nom. inval.)]|nr:hypothetical protein PybrP1_000509 [[Pythium] brassicae (nom. inval.)]